MQCTSEYPCPYQQVGLNVMLEMKERYKLPVGLSDHTMTIFAPIAAAALGAVVIEKHLTFSRKMYGSDAAHSLEPREFAQMVEGIRAVEMILRSQVDKNNSDHFRTMKEVFEKSLVLVEDVPAGTTLTNKMLGMKKPGTGIPARRLKEFIGRKTGKDLKANTLLGEEDLVA
jgi:N-acetylneuraminate synthase